ncbi:MAG: hypothetical protein F6J93_25600 [Oscillatoria sp. SIO1A7]|nr:hypothetical protein [Oscillatoria sp. SIO1A7]
MGKTHTARRRGSGEASQYENPRSRADMVKGDAVAPGAIVYYTYLRNAILAPEFSKLALIV